jgi:hypothetical protein
MKQIEPIILPETDAIEATVIDQWEIIGSEFQNKMPAELVVINGYLYYVCQKCSSNLRCCGQFRVADHLC